MNTDERLTLEQLNIVLKIRDYSLGEIGKPAQPILNVVADEIKSFSMELEQLLEYNKQSQNWDVRLSLGTVAKIIRSRYSTECRRTYFFVSLLEALNDIEITVTKDRTRVYRSLCFHVPSRVSYIAKEGYFIVNP